MMVYILLHEVLNIGFIILYPSLVLVISGFYLYYHRRLKSENKNLKTIGSIEFTRTGIRKFIGDSLAEFHYSSIKSIELQRHIPALTINESKSGFYTYILVLTFADSHIENLIVSDRPIGKWRDLSITETIKTLKKLILAEIIIK